MISWRIMQRARAPDDGAPALFIISGAARGGQLHVSSPSRVFRKVGRHLHAGGRKWRAAGAITLAGVHAGASMSLLPGLAQSRRRQLKQSTVVAAAAAAEAEAAN